MATNSSRNQKAVPEAREALNQFKYEVANELGITLKQGYNGDLTSKEAGYIGGNITRKLVEQAERQMAGKL